jgi:tetratricopeptide (TPR) repeat protein
VVRLIGLAFAGVLAWALPAWAAAPKCPDWVGIVVSAQGSVEVRRSTSLVWGAVALDDRLCGGDAVRVGDRARAAILLRTDAVLRLDENTTATFLEPRGRDPASWVEIVTGFAHFLSRIPRGLRIFTPFVNGTVEGTEFWVEVGTDRTRLAVIQGRVLAENRHGSLVLGHGEAAVARPGTPPTAVAIVQPRDAIQWALHYPSVVEDDPADFPDLPGHDWPALVRRSIVASRGGDLSAAFAALASARPDIADPRFFTYRARLLLAVGRVDEATADLERALRLAPRHGEALALQSLIAVVQGREAEALRLARTAADADPSSAMTLMSLSYAQQARFDLPAALASAEAAVARRPQSALAWARLAELRLSLARRAEAVAAATSAVAKGPGVSRTHTVLGFAHLAELRPDPARQSFERAITLDSADPLARLGLALAKIRAGDVPGGRRELEVAAGLDPGRSLVRSYLAKAYYEERRAQPAAAELATAAELDPNDPTPWFYDAILKQSENRPVEALESLQRAIVLNDHRAVDRSRLLLDQDLAARSASLARIYDDLGFQQLALAEGWSALRADPGSSSAHRLLADVYSVLPRHEVARVSELLQAQLLQPLNVSPIQPRLRVSDFFFPPGTGPVTASLHEWNPLFNRNQVQVRASGIVGGNETLGDDVAIGAVYDRLSISLGQAYYRTDGFRDNNDLRRSIWNAFAQVSLTPDTSMQVEFLHSDFERGDLLVRFDPDNFSPTLRQEDRTSFIRGGLRHTLAPGSDVIVSVIRHWGDFASQQPPVITIDSDVDGWQGELQHLWRRGRLSLVTGVGYSRVEATDAITVFDTTTVEDERVHQGNAYAYADLALHRTFTVTAGASLDVTRGGLEDRTLVNPKLGLTWRPVPTTTLRAAAFRTLKRELLSSQTVEPTQVAGFNQFFDDAEGTEAWRYGAGVDQTLARGLFAGVEGSGRHLNVPFIGTVDNRVSTTTWRETLGRAYLAWTPHPWLALGAEYHFERLRRDQPLDEGVANVRTHRIPLTVSVFHPSGLLGRVQASYVDQSGRFENSLGEQVPGSDRFWVMDVAAGYRLPRRFGIFTIETRNLFDTRFRFQETDRVRPLLYPERLVLGRLTLAY